MITMILWNRCEVYMLVRTQSWESLLALLKSNLDCFKLFAQVSIVLICGINLTKQVMSKVRVAYNNVFRLVFGYGKTAVPAKCLLLIIYVTLKVICEKVLMHLLCGMAAATISPRLERIAVFVLVLSDRNGLGVCILYIISVITVCLYSSLFMYCVLCLAVFFSMGLCAWNKIILSDVILIPSSPVPNQYLLN